MSIKQAQLAMFLESHRLAAISWGKYDAVLSLSTITVDQQLIAEDGLKRSEAIVEEARAEITKLLTAED